MKIKLFQCGGENSISEYPLGLGYLKSNCIANIKIIKNKNDLNNCDFIGLSTNAWGLKEAISILNKTNIPIILGGQGVLWKEIKNYPFKYIVYGDGEIALQTIINKNTNKLLHYPVQNIDNLKFPERGKCKERIPILTSRGCPFKCNFCSSNAFWGNVRYHSAEYFIDEVLDILNKYPQGKVLWILDDLFIGNKLRFEVIYKKWMSLNLNKKLKLRGFVRSSLITSDNAKQMKEMGFQRIRFGAESGSNKMLKDLNKSATVEQHQQAIDIANKIKLPISASFMYDLPGETLEDKKMTKEFIEKNKGKLLVEGWYKFKPFPGTKFYNGENPLTYDMRVR